MDEVILLNNGKYFMNCKELKKVYRRLKKETVI